MGSRIIDHTIEELYVANKILAKNYTNEKGEVNMPAMFIRTMEANTERSKVYATVSLKDQPYGEMTVYLLRYKNGEIASHEFLGKAGYHVINAEKTGILYEFDPEAEGNLNEAQLKMVGASLDLVTAAVKRHTLQAQSYFVAKEKPAGKGTK